MLNKQELKHQSLDKSQFPEKFKVMSTFFETIYKRILDDVMLNMNTFKAIKCWAFIHNYNILD